MLDICGILEALLFFSRTMPWNLSKAESVCVYSMSWQKLDII